MVQRHATLGRHFQAERVWSLPWCATGVVVVGALRAFGLPGRVRMSEERRVPATARDRAAIGVC